MEVLETDYLVIGSGLAGMMAAHKLSAQGDVVLATKREMTVSNSDWAQGGIAAVVDPSDTVENHVRDTLECGAGLCRKAVVRDIIEASADAIQDLEETGVRFARREGRPDEFDLGQEAGHSRRRVLHAGDITGHEVIQGMVQAVRANPRIQVLEGCMAIDLIASGWLKAEGDNVCIGAYFHRREDGRIFAVRAGATLLATGGAGKAYLYSTNPDTATGDGIAMAWRAGLPIRNMEFVQFHPTCLYNREVKSFLISEVVRGEGGRLINTDGHAFMHLYDDRLDLAPRDVVARAIDDQIKKRGDKHVFLDITHRDSAFIKDRFPTIYSTCLRLGTDMTKEPIPVVPAAHYFCGGVSAAVNGRTSLPGLFVIGESACTGLHGANRLASNSLLEAVVMATKAAETLAAEPSDPGRQALPIPAWQEGHVFDQDEAVVVAHNWDEIRTLMWDYVGIVRTRKRLERARRRVENLRREIREYYLVNKVTPDVLELRNIAAVAWLIVRSAMRRKESRGLHFTLDHPHAHKSVRETVLRDAPGGFP